MKMKITQFATSALVAASLLATTASAFSGAIYTSNVDASIINANHYALKADVYLNGGPKEIGGPGSIVPDGIYLFEVTDPSTGVLLSQDPAKNRQIVVFGGVVYGVPGAPLWGATTLHAVGVLTASGSIPVQLIPFADTPNGGGVYKVTLYNVAAGAHPDDDGDPGTVADIYDGMNIITPNGNSKSDNFKVQEGSGTGENQVIVFGRKYYDKNANGVYDDGEEWTTADGRPPVTINLTWDGGSTSEVTNDLGVWSHVFELPEGSTLDFSACEEPVAGYNQTGPLDGDSDVNGEALATALDFCWDATITSSLGLLNLNFGNVDTVTIGGVKYYDADADGEKDGGEVTIPGFKIILEITYPDGTPDSVEVITDAGGAWSYEVPVGSDVTACEVLPAGSWVQTAPELGCHSLEDVSDDASNLDFGNVCLGPGGGHTLGFWSNKNGQAQINDGGSMASELALLAALNLKNATGADFDPATYPAFRNWLLNATAVNMAYMLSAQLAAMELNVEAGFVDDGAIIYGGDCLGFTTINAVRTAANASLGTDGYTPDADPNRADQECLKNALDDANNNLNFVQANPCDVVYPEPEA